MKQKSIIGYIPFFILFVQIGCSSRESEQSKKEPIIVEVQEIEAETKLNYIENIAVVEPYRETLLSFELSGKIQLINVELGQQIGAQEIIASINNENSKNQYLSAQAILKQTQDRFNRYSEINNTNGISEIDMIELKTNLEKAQNNERILLKNLEECNLYPPYKGIISDIFVEKGSYVTPQTPICKLADISQVKVKLTIGDNQIITIKDGIQVEIYFPSMGFRTTGRLSEINRIANKDLFYVIKILLNNANQNILPGMICYAYLPQSSSLDTDYFIIPYNTIQLSQNLSYVWLVNTNNEVYKQEVIVGDVIANGVQILEGLKKGDKLVTAGFQNISIGDIVRITE